MNKVDEIIANGIALKRRQSFYLATYLREVDEKTIEVNSCNLVFSFMENIAKLGYTLTEDAIRRFISIQSDVLKELLPELIKNVKVLVGDDVVYEPMYPGFPEQVRNMSESTLYLNAIVHYLSGGTLFPNYDGEYEQIERLPLKYDELKKLDVISTYEEFESIFMNLINSKTSISADDRNDLNFYFTVMYDVEETLLPEIPMKENIAYIANVMIKSGVDIERLDAYYGEKNPVRFKTATDVLRLYVAMSDGDISLASPTLFRNLTRQERRLLMNLLNSVPYLNEDFVKYKEYWKRAGERIHPNSFSDKKYAKVHEAFFIIRSNKKIKSWNGEVDALIKAGDWNGAVDKLATRPGEYARKLDFLARSSSDLKYIVDKFISVVDQVSTPVLLQLRTHFLHSFYNINPDSLRVFFPKGGTAKAYSIENTIPKVPAEAAALFAQISGNELVNRFSKRGYLGKVYMDKSLQGFLVPFSQRSASTISRPCVRGSRIPLKPDTKFIRTFIWWKNMKDNTVIDIDSSVEFFDENLVWHGSVSYWKLINPELNAFHSGDITNGGPFDGYGASEFVDIDIDRLVEQGVRYAVMGVHYYNCNSEKGFSSAFPCRAGFMELDDTEPKMTRDSIQRNRVYRQFDPSRVEMSMDITSQTCAVIPIILDCKRREIVWADMGIPTNIEILNMVNINTTRTTVASYLYSVLNCVKPTLYDLILLHVRARGLLVDKKENADVVFSLTEGITPFDVDRFMSEFL